MTEDLKGLVAQLRAAFINRSDSGAGYAIEAADAIERLERERDEVRDKAIKYALDQAGIESRNREAIELVELRAENAELRKHVDAIERDLTEAIRTCEICGNPGTYSKGEGWLTTRCSEHMRINLIDQ